MEHALMSAPGRKDRHRKTDSAKNPGADHMRPAQIDWQAAYSARNGKEVKERHTQRFARDRPRTRFWMRGLSGRAHYGLFGASSTAWRMASSKLRSSALPVPAISYAVFCLKKKKNTGRPMMIFTQASRPITLITPCTASVYLQTPSATV